MSMGCVKGLGLWLGCADGARARESKQKNFENEIAQRKIKKHTMALAQRHGVSSCRSRDLRRVLHRGAPARIVSHEARH